MSGGLDDAQPVLTDIDDVPAMKVDDIDGPYGNPGEPGKCERGVPGPDRDGVDMACIDLASESGDNCGNTADMIEMAMGQQDGVQGTFSQDLPDRTDGMGRCKPCASIDQNVLATGEEIDV